MSLYQDFSNGNWTKAGARLGVATAAAATVYIPVVGPAVSIGIIVADYFWGEDFYSLFE